jgi:hypothetical protein
LFNYANASLKRVGEEFARRQAEAPIDIFSPGPIAGRFDLQADVLLVELKAKLTERVEFWRAEARRWVAECDAYRKSFKQADTATLKEQLGSEADAAHIAAAAADDQPDADSQRANTATRLSRAAWLQRELKARRWNIHTLEKNHGPSWKTARKVLDGQPVKRIVLEKIAAALSTKHAQVNVTDIPDD